MYVGVRTPLLPVSEGDKKRNDVRQRLIGIDFGWAGVEVNASDAGGTSCRVPLLQPVT